MNYVIKNKRLKDYLYDLGFHYKEVPDKTGKQKYVYLFPDEDILHEAISFYTNFKNKFKEKELKY